MMMARTSADRCPGVLRLHEAADGSLARVRVPGGILGIEHLTGLIWNAETLGDGHVEVTSRGNVQLRGLTDVDDLLVRSLTAYGFLPNPDLELARTILVSPLSGLDGRGLRDATRELSALDQKICATDTLSGLSGRFAFGLDDGRGDVLGLSPDLTAVAVDAARYSFVVAGRPTGLAAPAAAVPDLLVDAAAHFVAWAQARDQRVWRIEEALDGVGAVTARLASAAQVVPWAGPLPTPAPPPGTGRVEHGGRVHLVAAVPWGRAPAPVWRLLGGLCGPAGVRVTPWNTVVLTDVRHPVGAAAALTKVGLHPHPGTPWARVSACIGGRGCARTGRDVRAEAAAMLGDGAAAIADLELGRAGSTARVHWSGCERRCGRPRLPYRDLLAVQGGWSAEDR